MSPLPPVLYGTLLAAIVAAGASHYWSVEKFVSNFPVIPSFRIVPADLEVLSPVRTPPEPVVLPQPIAQVANSPAQPEEAHSAEFFEKLIQELGNLRNENRALNNQIAETNRDVMKMQFQIDTHSESFRPLPTSQERGDTSYTLDFNLPGVLPPKAEPVFQVDQ